MNNVFNFQFRDFSASSFVVFVHTRKIQMNMFVKIHQCLMMFLLGMKGACLTFLVKDQDNQWGILNRRTHVVLHHSVLWFME